MDKILKIIENNAKLTPAEIAVMAGISEAEAVQKLAEYEKDGVIRGYKTIIDNALAGDDKVIAQIEIKVTPKTDFGFDDIAKRIAQFDEVEAIYLMSGGYDLLLTVSGRNFKEIATFVQTRLAPLDSVVSTTTHFVLSAYKQSGVLMYDREKDERGQNGL